ncbi:MAG: hypothetical protein JWO13_1917 [Acidobacteriales bacterium]|nr:hypothetical protein [Terriglobales bacterium]
MKRVFALVLGILLLAPQTFSLTAPAKPRTKTIKKDPLSTDKRFKSTDAVIDDYVKKNLIPGAVLLVGQKGKILYRKAYGNRSLQPTVEPMTVDTIFDIASLTKCVATTTSVMRLLQLGQIRLNDPVSRYLPELGNNGKEDITIRQLMTHYSGLRPDLDLRQPWNGSDTAMRMIIAEKPTSPVGAQFVYSDINFEILGFLVERLSGLSLDKYSSVHVFQPLKMTRTSYLPPHDWIKNIAPTQFDEQHVMLRGIVHDPTARRMGGVAGHAGLFSTASDLSIFAQALLSGDKILSRAVIEKMSTPQTPPTSTSVRGLGWDIDTPFASNRGELLPIGSFGHTGFTGTSLWIDPFSKTYVILLTNSVHPNGPLPGGPTVALRTKVMTAITAALKLDVDLDSPTMKKAASITGYNEAAVGSHRPVSRNGKVFNGIDMLESSNFEQIRNKRETTRIGLLTNQTGIALDGRRTIDVLANAPGVKLTAIFSPEHGAVGEQDTTDIKQNPADAKTSVPIYSVYGTGDASRRPSAEVLKTLDAVVIDIQDVGARFYTYETSMGYFLEAAASAGIEVYVLDRPNPIGGVLVQGPVANTEFSFVNYHAIPPRHGMTLGELARFYNTERKINAKLTVIPMQGWIRGDWFDATNEMWVNPSPNMRNLNEATLYTGVALVEGTNVSVGRGTDTPFEVVGAPWMKSRELADYLNGRQIAGVRFVPTTFTPASAVYAKQLCNGVNVIVTDRYALDAPELGVELASAFIKLYPKDYKPEKMIRLLSNTAAFQSLLSGTDPRRIADDWRDDLDQFMQLRSKYLIYK